MTRSPADRLTVFDGDDQRLVAAGAIAAGALGEVRRGRPGHHVHVRHRRPTRVGVTLEAASGAGSVIWVPLI
jgi:hypothetical protein